MVGHAWQGENGDQPRQLLSYVEARRKIYLPAFHWVIENAPAVKQEVIKLARAATEVKFTQAATRAACGSFALCCNGLRM